MSAASNIGQLKERLAVYWIARTEQERKFLAAGAAVAVLALVYVLFVGPALDGRAQLQKALPDLRQQAAQLQAMAQEAGALAHQPAVQLTPMTRDSLTASLAARSIVPQSLSMTGEYAKLQLNNVSFANLVTWLDTQRRENRITVQDASISANATAGQVDASLTLHQNSGPSGAGAG
jgi:general secretion pathway protein M